MALCCKHVDGQCNKLTVEFDPYSHFNRTPICDRHRHWAIASIVLAWHCAGKKIAGKLFFVQHRFTLCQVYSVM